MKDGGRHAYNTATQYYLAERNGKRGKSQGSDRRISLCKPPNVERFNRIFREEVLNFYVFNRLSEVRDITENWLREYNEQRPP